MVIVRLGLDQRDGRISDEVWGEFLAKIGQALTPEVHALADWRSESARREIAPRAWKDPSRPRYGQPTLALAGRGSRAVDGRWTRTMPVIAGQHYRFETLFEADRDSRGGRI